ncbi:MAG: TldD/PmbA family protein [Pseudomonadota bacterium]
MQEVDTETATADRDLAAALVEAARAAGAAEADVIVASATAASVGVAARELEEAERAETREAGLRVIVDTEAGRAQACVAGSDLRIEALREMATRAVAMARVAPPDPYCGLASSEMLSEHRDADALDLEDPDPVLSPEALEETALAIEAASLAVEGVVQVSEASVSWSRERLTMAQSNGFIGAYGRSATTLGVTAIAGAGLGRERDYAVETRRHRADLPSAESIGRLAGERTIARLNPKRPPAGTVPVILDERVAASLIGHVMSAANGASVARGSSWLDGRLGERVLPEGVDVIEEPLIPRGRASRPFDAEGLPALRRAMITDGVLERWVLDLASARQLGLESTGNARRGLGGPPSPGLSNLRMTAGTTDAAGFAREVGTGFLVTSFIGASINPTTGAYSRGASGFWIEGGEIAYPVNEVTLAGSLPEIVATIVPGNDADPAKAVSVPSLLVEGLTLGA